MEIAIKHHNYFGGPSRIDLTFIIKQKHIFIVVSTKNPSSMDFYDGPWGSINTVKL